MESVNINNKNEKASKKLGIVAIIFSSISLAILFFIWGLVVYASITKDFGNALGAAIYFAIGVFVQLLPAVVGGICGIVQKKNNTKFAIITFVYTIIVDIVSISSVIYAIFA
jgi:hypothetical protein